MQEGTIQSTNQVQKQKSSKNAKMLRARTHQHVIPRIHMIFGTLQFKYTVILDFEVIAPGTKTVLHLNLKLFVKKSE